MFAGSYTDNNLFVNFIYKKIYYFYSDAGTHLKCGIFIVKSSNFYYFRSKF